MKIIKLTRTDTTILVNAEHISSVTEAYNGAKAVVTMSDGQYFRVCESPDEIFALINKED